MFPIRDHNPSERRPFVTYALIVINVAVFLSYALRLQEPALSFFFYDWGMVPLYLSEGLQGYGLITHMFLHAGWMHLIGNMLFLFIFGDNMEDQMGHFSFAVFYLLSGLAAAGLQYAAAPMADVPMVGASGAISGVMGGYLLLYPKARVDVLFIFVIFFRVFAVPAWAVLGVWFAMQVLGGAVTPTDLGGVAYWAHAGGFAAGLLLTLKTWFRLGGPAFWAQNKGMPPHPETKYRMVRSNIPRVPRR